MKKCFPIILLLFLPLIQFAQFAEVVQQEEAESLLSTYRVPPFLIDSNDSWVQKIMKNMSEEERIAQLFMVAAYSNKGVEHQKEIEELIRKYKIGGLIFFQGGPVRQAILTNKYQSISKVPLLMAIDGEWGLSMRLDSTITYPRQMALGAISEDAHLYEMGKSIAIQCRELGIHVNFAPVIDINNNPNNPVINSRSFGEEKENVAQKGIAYMKGMQDQNVLACGKHFPGHGDTDKDSHKALPLISHDKARLNELELYPFRETINKGLGSVMVAHLNVPALDSSTNMATTLSQKVVTGLLKEELGFKGLIFTDALNMKGVSSYFEPGEVDLKALLAGNDVLLFAENVPKAIDKIKGAIKEGLITQEEVDRMCAKILKAKKWVGLNEYKPIKIEGLVNRLNAQEHVLTKRNVVKNSITLIKNETGLVPVKSLDSFKIATISVGAKGETQFQKSVDRYCKTTHFSIGKNPSYDEIIKFNEKLADFDLFVVGVHGLSQYPRNNFGLTQEINALLELIEGKGKMVLSYFGNPYGLKTISVTDEVESIVVAYHDDNMTQSYVAEAIFGGIPISGKLPVSFSENYKAGVGIVTASMGRFSYGQPEEMGINSKLLDNIDSIALEGIRSKAYPGCQVLVAKGGNVIYQKSFGYHTYDEEFEVKESDVYDLASITKIAASTFGVMKLQDDGLFNLDYYLCDYLPEFTDSSTEGYGNIVLREMMAHKAGLVPWIPFYQSTLANGYPMYDYYSLVQSETYPFKVAENLFMHKDGQRKILGDILSTPLRDEKEYKYSDLGYYFIQQIIEKQSGMPLNEFVEKNFYTPMGLATAGYLPAEHIEKDRLIPTEYDKQFRRQLVHGVVHDPGAAMMGGVAGHAGLFSNANDLAKIMQCFANMGEYGGRRYVSASTVQEFIDCQFCEEDNRRGAGFDKPVRSGRGGPTCSCVSYDSFGHSGFTGTLAWADPTEDVVYIFLSNRVYPDASNYKLIEMDIRTRIMEVIYDAIEQSKSQKEG